MGVNLDFRMRSCAKCQDQEAKWLDVRHNIVLSAVTCYLLAYLLLLAHPWMSVCLRVASIPARSQFRPVAERRRRTSAGARVSGVGLAGTERVVVPRPRPHGADAGERPAGVAVDARARTTSRFTPDHRRRRTGRPSVLHVRRVVVVGRVGRQFTSEQCHRPRQS